jgi:hypothetical protein
VPIGDDKTMAFKCAAEAESDVKIGEVYTTEEIAKLGFTTTSLRTGINRQIYRRGRDRCILELIGDGNLKVLSTYQL